jgi:sortase A
VRTTPAPTAAARTPRRGSAVLTAAGELLVTLGAVVLLFAGYLVVGTGWAAARDQEAAAEELAARWAAPPAAAPGPSAPDPTAPDATAPDPTASSDPAAAPPPAAGEPVLRLEVPRFGRAFTVLEGVDAAVLARGPGRYPGSPEPGEPGNLALAGHRTTRGAPFDAADALRPCDPLVLQTRDAWWIHRVLPCGPDLPADYARVPGVRVVAPDDRGVLAPVPGRPGAEPTAALLTLTTCHPRFSARERLVVHAVLVRSQPVADGRPAELGEA